MEGWNSTLTQVRDALAYLYDNWRSARTVAVTAGIDPAAIDAQGSVVEIWQGILERAEKNEHVQAILAAADAYRSARRPQAAHPPVVTNRADLYSHASQIRLQRILYERLKLRELKQLCFVLGIDYEDSTGAASKMEKTLVLIQYLVRREQLEDLLRAGAGLRPDIAWR